MLLVTICQRYHYHILRIKKDKLLDGHVITIRPKYYSSQQAFQQDRPDIEWQISYNLYHNTVDDNSKISDSFTSCEQTYFIRISLLKLLISTIFNIHFPLPLRNLSFQRRLGVAQKKEKERVGCNNQVISIKNKWTLPASWGLISAYFSSDETKTKNSLLGACNDNEYLIFYNQLLLVEKMLWHKGSWKFYSAWNYKLRFEFCLLLMYLI